MTDPPHTPLDSALDRSDLLHGVMDAIDANVALLDGHGTIIDVNESWRRYGRANGLRMRDDAIGVNYLELCRAASGECTEEAPAVASALEELACGRRSSYVLEYPCHSPDERRWFAMRAVGLPTLSARIILFHRDITKRKLAQLAVERRFIDLTDREYEVLPLLARGLSSKQIARELGISTRTAENHRYHIISKTGAENVADLVRLATIGGLVPSLP